MGAPCSKMVDRDVEPPKRLSKKQPSQRNAPNPIVDPSCPLHGTNAHVHAAETTTAAATHGVTPASRRPVEGGVPASPVSTRFFTPVASHGPGALALTTPATRAGAAPAEDEHEPASTYVRSKRGGIRKTGLQLLRPARAYVVGQPATLTVEIRNAQPRPLAGGAHLLLLDNGYFAEAALPLPEIGAGQTVTVEVPARPKRSTLTLKDLKGELELRVTRGSELLMAQIFLLDALDFAGDLMPPVEATEGQDGFLNLYLLGAKGSGKTAFLQTLASVLGQTAPPSNEPLPPTTELDRLNVAKLVAAAGEGRFGACPLNFRVFDLWGKDSFGNDSELPAVLAGQTPLGFSATDTIAALSVEDQADLAATLPQRAAHGALFFVAPTDVDDPVKLEALKATFEAAKAALGGHAPLVVLGRGDGVEGKLVAEPLNWSSKKIATLRKRLATAFGVSWAQTFVAVPYAALPAKPTSAPSSFPPASMTAQPGTHDQPALDGSLSLSLSKATTGPARNFDVDRLALLIASAALEAARLRAEGKAPAQPQPLSALPATPRSVHTPASVLSTRVGSVRRQQTVELSTMDGSFSSNFVLPKSATTKIETHTPISAIDVEKSEAEAP